MTGSQIATHSVGLNIRTMKYFKILDGKHQIATNVIEFEERQIINPTHEQMLLAGWEVYNEDVMEADPLEIAIINKIQEIEDYDNSISVNSFTVDGEVMWIGFEERQRLRSSIDAYKSIGKDKMTKWHNGKKFDYPISTWEYMINALSVYSSEALNITEQHKINVRSLKTIEDVNNYDYTKNYPMKCSF